MSDRAAAPVADLRIPVLPVLDPLALAELQRLDPTGVGGFVQRILRTFESSAARLATTLAEARRTGDHQSVLRVAHTFKSAGAHIGASTLVALSRRIEAAMVVDLNADVARDLDALDEVLELTLVAVAQRLGLMA